MPNALARSNPSLPQPLPVIPAQAGIQTPMGDPNNKGVHKGRPYGVRAFRLFLHPRPSSAMAPRDDGPGFGFPLSRE